MRHGRKTSKLQRPANQRRALLSNLVCNLIEHKQIKTTLAKAKAMRPFADRMVTLGKRGDVHARRIAVGYLHSKDAVSELFGTIAPAAAHRQGGYTRITKLGQRHSDSAPMAFIEWMDTTGAAAEAEPVEIAEEPKDEKAPARKTAAKKATAKKAAPKKEKADDAE